MGRYEFRRRCDLGGCDAMGESGGTGRVYADLVLLTYRNEVSLSFWFRLPALVHYISPYPLSPIPNLIVHVRTHTHNPLTS